MRVVPGKFNDLSKELLAKVPKLNHGETVTFIMNTGLANPDPDPAEKAKKPMLYPKRNIPMTDRVKDGDKGWKDIILADAWDGDKPLSERFFMPGLDLGGIFNGKFSLTGGNTRDEELYEYLMLCNYNESSVLGADRDTAKPALFKLIDAKKDSVAITSRNNILFEALKLAKDIKKPEAELLAKSLNWNEYATFEELHARVSDFARDKPDEFLKVYNDPNKQFKADIKAALDKKVLTYDMRNGEVMLGTQLITTVRKDLRGDVFKALSEWFNESPNGKDVLEKIKEQLEEKEAVPA